MFDCDINVNVTTHAAEVFAEIQSSKLFALLLALRVGQPPFFFVVDPLQSPI